jgi:hypothetical protein
MLANSVRFRLSMFLLPEEPLEAKAFTDEALPNSLIRRTQRNGIVFETT